MLTLEQTGNPCVSGPLCLLPLLSYLSGEDIYADTFPQLSNFTIWLLMPLFLNLRMWLRGHYFCRRKKLCSANIMWTFTAGGRSRAFPNKSFDVCVCSGCGLSRCWWSVMGIYACLTHSFPSSFLGMSVLLWWEIQVACLLGAPYANLNVATHKHICTGTNSWRL